MSASSSTPVRKPEKVIIPVATDERCWFKCKQTNVGRFRGKDPRCSMFCYYSNKIPTVVILPPSELLPTHPPASQDSSRSESETPSLPQIVESDDLEDRRASLIERYTIPSLRGKFIYFAIGKPAIARHLASMRRVHSVEHKWIDEKLREENEDQSEWEQVPKRPTEQTNRGVMVLAYHRDYERTINISYSIASVFASIHLHFERLYGPTYKIISKLPNSISGLMDPEQTTISTQFTLLNRLLTRPILSDSIALANRSAESLVEVLSRLSAKYFAQVSDLNKKGRSGSPPSSSPST